MTPAEHTKLDAAVARAEGRTIYEVTDTECWIYPPGFGPDTSAVPINGQRIICVLYQPSTDIALAATIACEQKYNVLWDEWSFKRNAAVEICKAESPAHTSISVMYDDYLSRELIADHPDRITAYCTAVCRARIGGE